jgi:hypothetical protein
MKKETSFALYTVLAYYFISFAFGFVTGVLEAAGLSMEIFMSIAMWIVAPALSIYFISNSRKIDLNLIERKSYFSSLLITLLIVSIVFNIFKFKAVIVLILSGTAMRSTSEIIGNLVGQVAGGVIITYLLFILGFWIVKKIKKV